MATTQIKHRHTGAVLFEHQATDEQRASGIAMRVALEAACKAKADLGGADLRGAYLVGADLGGADLGGKKLVGARPLLVIGPIGSRSDYLHAYITDAGVMVRAGCFEGSRDEFVAAVSETHGDNEHGREYAAALAMIDAHAAIWTPAVEPVAEAA